MATDENKSKDEDQLARMPDEVRGYVVDEISAEDIAAWSAYDLSAGGEYYTGYLVLAEGRLGHFTSSDDGWRAEWMVVGELAEAVVVEGLGVSVLQLNDDEALQAEFRFTKRHARTMAQLHQHLKRQLGTEEDEKDGESRGQSHEPGGHKKQKARCDKCDSVIPDWAEACPRCLKQRRVLMRLLEFIRPYKWRATIGLSLAIAGTAVGLAPPLITKRLVDGAILGPEGHLLGWLVVLLAGTFVVGVTLRAIRGRLMAGLGMRVAAEIRDKCYGHLQKLSLSYFSRKSTGSLVTRVTSDSDRVWDFVAMDLVEIVVGLLTFVGVGVMLFVVNWKLAALVLIPIPPMMVLMTIFHRRMHGQFSRIWHRWSAMTAVVADAIPGMRVIKAFGQEKREFGRFHKRNYQVYEEEGKLIRVFTYFGPSMMLTTQAAFLIIWAVGGYWCIQDLPAVQAAKAAAKAKGIPSVTPPGLMTIGGLMAFQALMHMFYRPIHMVAHMSRTFNRAATSVQRIFEVLDTEPEIFSKHEAAAMPKLGGRIELRNVSFSYDGVRRVLQDVNLTIEPGEMIGLVGHSGSGKTTLVNLICRFYDVVEGQILLDGVDIRDYRLEDLRRHIGVVLQEPHLFRGTVAENIAYGNPDAGPLEVIEAARAANVHNEVVGFPDGYDTYVGERGHTLSGGERQRVSIARAVLNNPQLLILDEATSNVDTHTEKRIQEALDHLVTERTTIAIAHRLSTLQRADRLVVLDKGRITELGTHTELAEKEDGVYAGLLNMQAEAKSVMALKG